MAAPSALLWVHRGWRGSAYVDDNVGLAGSRASGGVDCEGASGDVAGVAGVWAELVADRMGTEGAEAVEAIVLDRNLLWYVLPHTYEGSLSQHWRHWFR